MPSIFTRSRIASTPSKKNKNKTLPDQPTTIIDEFGRVTSRGSIATTSKKEKKDKDKDKRQRTHSAPQDTIDPQSVPDGSFMPFSWGRLEDDDEPRAKVKEYGYMSHRSEVVLGIDEVSRLVNVIAAQLNERGLTTPLLFSNLALDISRTRIHRLIDSFLATCPSYNHHSGSPIDMKWREEAKFAGPHELGMALRWGLARIVRIYGGQETRGIIAWDMYLRWREDETANQYPQNHFAAFLPYLPPPIQRLLLSLLTLLSRLTTHATTSGLTPPTLASLFGPLLFGLGSTTLPFHHTYGAYLRCSHAAEHLLLSYVRSQPPPLPSRLADWIRGYPAMLPAPDKLDKARSSAKIVRLNTIKRNVRLYSVDLVRTAAGWDVGGSTSREWNRVVGPPGMRLGVKYSEGYRKRMDLPPGSGPEIASTASPDTASHTMPQDEQRFRSLTDLKWGEFESLGFGSGEAASKRLEFDLNEGARNAHASPTRALSWTDFSESGFSLTDAPLSATLQFSAPLSHTITAWPARQNELQAKLRKTQKALPPFGWDTTPTLGGEEAVEEGFVSVFCDFLAGGGWVDRAEGTFRECNWAMVEYKSTPQTRPPTPLPPDPRTSSSVWLYEEFVPPEYQALLTAPRRKMPLTLPFSRSHNNVNALKVTRVPNARELEFEGLLGGGMGNVTKVISLGGGTTTVVGGRSMGRKDSFGISGPMYVGPTPGAPVGLEKPKPELTSALPPPPPIKIQPPLPPPLPSLAVKSPDLPPLPSPLPTPTPTTPSATSWTRFRPGGTIRKRSSPAGAEYDASIEFETRTMFAGDDTEGEGEPEVETKVESESMLKKRLRRQGHVRRESKDDAWIDILVKDKSQSASTEQNKGVAAGSGTFRKRRSLGDMGVGEAERVREEIRGVLEVEPLDDDDVEETNSTYSAADEMIEGEGNYSGMMDEEGGSEPLGDLLPTHSYSHNQHARKESGLLPLGLMLNHPHPTASPKSALLATAASQPPPETPPKQIPTPKSATKGVSSLIEMYREKEKERDKETGVGPSKLPVRTSSLGAGPNTLSPPRDQPRSLSPSLTPQPRSVSPNSQLPVPITVSVPSQPQVRPISPAPPSIPDEDLTLEDLGLSPPLNPATPRYVHGAPLHNVVEEEGEEEVDL